LIPFSVIGGFLGAGKTTLINRLLGMPQTPRLAILVNDFGDIEVDRALLETHDGDTIALKNGCVCCSIGNDLSRALGRVLDSERPVDAIVVEASGVANPRRVMDIARISSELEPAGILVVVDAAALESQLEDRWIADTVTTQLASADRYFISKLDTGAAALARLARDYPDVEQVPGFDTAWQLFALPGKAVEPRPAETRTHARFCSRSLISDRALDPERLRAWLGRRDDVYRIKGWVRQGQDEFRLLQYAGGRITWTGVESDGHDKTRLVVIGRVELPTAEEILEEIAER
jgi:G3E family GTPase